jgi:ParB-like chromosome segregation protein Spo0J
MSAPRSFEPHTLVALAALSPTRRSPLDTAKVAALTAVLRCSGTIMPPVYVIERDGRHVVVDGHHRCRAALLAGFDAVPALVVSP